MGIEPARNDIHPIFQCTLSSIAQDPNDPLLFKCNFIPRTEVNDNTFLKELTKNGINYHCQSESKKI